MAVMVVVVTAVVGVVVQLMFESTIFRATVATAYSKRAMSAFSSLRVEGPRRSSYSVTDAFLLLIAPYDPFSSLPISFPTVQNKYIHMCVCICMCIYI